MRRDKWIYNLIAKVFIILSLFTSKSVFSEIIEDSWYEYFWGEKKLGYMHIKTEKVMGDENFVFVTTIYSKMNAQRMGTPLEVEEKYSFVDDLKYSPLKFNAELIISKKATILNGIVKDNNLEVSQKIGEMITNKVIPLPEGTIFPSAKIMVMDRNFLASGKTKEVNIFFPEFMSVSKVSITAIAREYMEILGENKYVYKVKYMMDLMPQVETFDWVTSDGQLIKSLTSIMGIEVKILKSTRGEALKEAEPVELMISNLIVPDKLLPNPETIRYLKVNLKARSGKVPDSIPSDDVQFSVRTSDTNFLIEIKQKPFPQEAIKPDLREKPELIKFLQPTLYVQSEAKEIVKTAKKVARGYNLPNKARELTYWVYRNITSKTLGVGFASAMETFQTKEGDCTEHSVLLAAMLRAVDIPARICGGLVYSDELSAFGYHMWVEAYLDRWVGLDPTLGQVGIDATHIKLVQGPMDEKNIADFGAILAQVIANSDIEILDYK